MSMLRTAWNPYHYYGLTAYRIWYRQVSGIWQQRHEWQREDGSICMEDWIRGVGPSKSAEPVTDEETP